MVVSDVRGQYFVLISVIDQSYMHKISCLLMDFSVSFPVLVLVIIFVDLEVP